MLPLSFAIHLQRTTVHPCIKLFIWFLLYVHKGPRSLFTCLFKKDHCPYFPFCLQGTQSLSSTIHLQRMQSLCCGIHSQRTLSLSLLFICEGPLSLSLLFICKGPLSLSGLLRSWFIFSDWFLHASFSRFQYSNLHFGSLLHNFIKLSSAMGYSFAKECYPCLRLFICKVPWSLCYSFAKDCGTCFVPLVCRENCCSCYPLVVPAR